jgi:hypothetical protein
MRPCAHLDAPIGASTEEVGAPMGASTFKQEKVDAHMCAPTFNLGTCAGEFTSTLLGEARARRRKSTYLE